MQMATGVRPFADCVRDDPDYHTVVEMGYGRFAPAQQTACTCQKVVS